MNPKEKLIEDHPQLSESRIDQIIEESKRKVDDKERDVVLNEDNIPIWKGFEEISEEQAISLFKSGEIVFVIDYEGQEAKIKDESYLNSSHAYAIERNFQDDDN